jgi:acetate kinase
VLAEYDPRAASGRTIVAHLGNGASLCAMQDRISRGTTMGFSTLDGLLMGTRPGNLDPGVVLYLLREGGMSVQAVEHLLYHECGLLGVSGGLTSDMRTLLASPRRWPNRRWRCSCAVSSRKSARWRPCSAVSTAWC